MTARSASSSASCSAVAASGSARGPAVTSSSSPSAPVATSPYYGADVHLVGIELSPEMLALAQERRRELGKEADLQFGDAQALEFEAEHFDTVVCTLALCTIPDHRAAIAEAYRVLRPGGRFVFLEHVRSPARSVRAVQRLLEPLAIRFEADHLTREPLEHLSEAGFEVEELKRSKWGIVERVAARKPERGA